VTLIATGVQQEEHVELVRNLAERIQRAGGRMNRLIGDLVGITSIEAGALAVTLEVADPTHVLEEA
jgi:signal transduction histidine kinase